VAEAVRHGSAVDDPPSSADDASAHDRDIAMNFEVFDRVPDSRWFERLTFLVHDQDVLGTGIDGGVQADRPRPIRGGVMVDHSERQAAPLDGFSRGIEGGVRLEHNHRNSGRTVRQTPNAPLFGAAKDRKRHDLVQVRIGLLADRAAQDELR